MKKLSALIIFAWLMSGAEAEEGKAIPMPRVKLDPVSHQAVPEAAKTVTPPAAGAGESPPVLMMDRYYVRGKGGGPKEAPKQEEFQGKFNLTQGGRLMEGKMGGAKYEVGVWPYFDFTKPGSTSFREGGPRLNVDFLHIKW